MASCARAGAVARDTCACTCEKMFNARIVLWRVRARMRTNTQRQRLVRACPSQGVRRKGAGKRELCVAKMACILPAGHVDIH